MPSTPSQKSIDVCRLAPVSVMWCTPWLWSFCMVPTLNSIPDRLFYELRRQGTARATSTLILDEVLPNVVLPGKQESGPGNSAAEIILTHWKSGDPGMTRTCDLRFRKPSLYPAELRDRSPGFGKRGLGS